MSKINQKAIDNTKMALREALEHLTKVSDTYVDTLVSKAPSHFADEGANPDAVINPYPLIQDMARLMNKKLEEFITDFRRGNGEQPLPSRSKKPILDS